MCVTSATRLFLHSINQLSTALVLVSQVMFYWASLHVCVLSYPLQLPLVQNLLSLATKWKRVKRGGTANTSYCLSFQEHPCMLTVTWRPVVNWREAVILTRVQSLLSSSSILSSFFSSSVSSSLFLLLIHRLFYFLFVISLFADVDECTASTPVRGVHFNCTNTMGYYQCEYTITAAVRVRNQFIIRSYLWSTWFPGL